MKARPLKILALTCVIIAAFASGVSASRFLPVQGRTVEGNSLTINVHDYLLVLTADKLSVGIGENVTFTANLTLNSLAVPLISISLIKNSDNSTAATGITGLTGICLLVWRADEVGNISFHPVASVT